MQVKRIIILLLVLLSIKANAQMVNRFRDSTWFAKGVQFDSTVNIKGLKVGTENDTFIMVCRADGNIYKVDKSNFIKNVEYLPLAGGTMYEGATINFPNGSKLTKGTTNANLGGNNGIAFKCSIDYEMKWEAGRLYIMQQDGTTIRQSLYNFNVVPTVNDDNLKGYTTGSLWTLDDNTTYVCYDASAGAAVWVKINNLLFPNGVNFITEDYEIQSSDEGKLIIGISDSAINITMPTGIIFTGGKSLGINIVNGGSFQISNSTGLVKILSQINTGFGTNEHTSELVFFTTFPDDGSGNSLLVPISTYIVNDNDTLKTSNKYFFDKSQNGISINILSDSLAQIRTEITDTANVLRGLIPDVTGYATITNLKDSTALVRGLIPDVTSYATKTNLKDSTALVRGLIPDVTSYATKTALKDTSAILRGLINAKASTTALSDTATTLRNIRKVDSTYQSINSGRDSMVFVRVINGITYRSALRDSINPLPTFTFVKNSAKDSIIATYNGTRSAVKDSVRPLQTFTFAKNSAKDSIIATFDGVRSAVKDSTGGGGVSLSGLTAATATNSIANASYLQTWNWANSSASKGGLSLIVSDTTTTEGTTGIPTTAPLFVKRTGTITTGNYSYAASFINESTANLAQRGVYFRAGAAGSTTAGSSVVAENAIHIVKNSGVSNGLYFGTINDYTGDASIIRLFNVAQLTVKSPTSGTIYLYPQSTSGTYIQSSTSEIMNLGVHTSTKSALGFGTDFTSSNYRAQTTTAAVIERNSDALKFSANSGLSGGYANFTPTFQLNIVGSTNNVGIGTTTPVTTAKLEIVSTTQGFLPPRMTTTQINAIASPAEGLVVYNTTLHELCFYDGTGWHKFSHSNM